MAQIIPFKAILPNPAYADQLVLTKPQAESVAGSNQKPEQLPPLKDLLETGARLRPETPEGQAAAYSTINATLGHLLETHRLVQEETPGIYVYEVEHPTYRQTGIWALTGLEDYRSGNIRKHELTLEDSVRRLKNYRAHTRLEGNPVLLTYIPNPTIDRIIEKTKLKQEHSTIGNSYGVHRLWKIEDSKVQQQLIDAFALIDKVYLADGHHRLESAVQLAETGQSFGQPVYDALSSLYMSTTELRIQEYDRAVVLEEPLDSVAFLKQLLPHFYIQLTDQFFQPKEIHHIGLYLNCNWYKLLPKPNTYAHKTLADSIDAAILQDRILAPLFGITDPKTDKRLKCIGGRQAIEELLTFIAGHPYVVAFTLCPLTVEELIAVADAGNILPPKSTWIDPKVPYGLILYQHQPLH
ncbi:DUF1015 family protein [Mucilaginibacter sp.]|uniref:DUF1015 family protein n=1 Tax=Mucilaginibacter sp. TaxID=1882438 RepID=UPI00261B9B95|nr:DUF1015 family protein [Mucilaginibacter sp.]MDB5031098.1 hypothetical protein [Mucilaginibacter sp.]